MPTAAVPANKWRKKIQKQPPFPQRTIYTSALYSFSLSALTLISPSLLGINDEKEFNCVLQTVKIGRFQCIDRVTGTEERCYRCLDLCHRRFLQRYQ